MFSCGYCEISKKNFFDRTSAVVSFQFTWFVPRRSKAFFFQIWNIRCKFSPHHVRVCWDMLVFLYTWRIFFLWRQPSYRNPSYKHRIMVEVSREPFQNRFYNIILVWCIMMKYYFHQIKFGNFMLKWDLNYDFFKSFSEIYLNLFFLVLFFAQCKEYERLTIIA